MTNAITVAANALNDVLPSEIQDSILGQRIRLVADQRLIEAHTDAHLDDLIEQICWIQVTTPTILDLTLALKEELDRRRAAGARD